MGGLFEPITIRGVKLKNRIVFAPVVTNFGPRSERTAKYYSERAAGGAGLLIVHGTPVDLLLNPAWAEGLTGLVKGVHRNGGKIVIQLWHGNELNGQAIAPSADGTRRAATREELRTVVEKFALAALRCREAGFDGAEVHGAHGYFINQFFSPLTNFRTDDYGGPVENRLRLGRELIGAMRRQAGDQFLLFFRHSAVDGEPGGTTIEESILLAGELEKNGLDVFDVSAGRGRNDDFSIPDDSAPEGTHAGLAAEIKRSVSIPVIAVGRVQSKAVAEKILLEGKADLIALGRQLLADPFWPQKIQEGREEEIVFCTYCNTCTTEMRAGRKILCPQNPDL